jgi:voltage-gated potassium channel
MPALRLADVRAIWRRAAFAAASLLALLAAGTAAYVVVEGWSVGDALYMTAITISTAGYREVHPLSDAGRWVTYGVLLGGVSWLALWFATATAFFIESDVFHLFRERRMAREIADLSDHYVVCGAGRTGTQVVAEFLRNGAPYVAVEADADRVAQLRAEAPHLRVLHGDATRDEVLVAARVASARGLVAALADDADNLFVTIAAKALNPRLRVVARVNDDDNVAKLGRAGADHVVSPQRIGGARMASMLLRPGVISLLDIVTRGGGVTLEIEEVAVPRGSRAAGRSLAELEVARRTRALVIAIRRAAPAPAPSFVFNPGANARLAEGDVLVVIGESDQVRALGALLADGGAPPAHADPAATEAPRGREGAAGPGP